MTIDRVTPPSADGAHAGEPTADAVAAAVALQYWLAGTGDILVEGQSVREVIDGLLTALRAARVPDADEGAHAGEPHVSSDWLECPDCGYTDWDTSFRVVDPHSHGYGPSGPPAAARVLDADTERLDWLLAHQGCIGEYPKGVWHFASSLRSAMQHPRTFDSARDAIDAARRATPSGAGPDTGGR